MPLPSPNLDDRDFEELVDAALSAIRQTCPEWSDLSPSDPGVVLLEAFAHLTETMLYRLNRLPEKAYVALLNLIGVQPYPPCAASVELTFSLKETPHAALAIPAGTRVTTPRGPDGAEGPLFETLRPVTLSADQRSVKVQAAHCSSVRGELCGTGTGLPGQSVRVSQAPILASNLPELELLVGVEIDPKQVLANVLTLECEGRIFRAWREVEGFHDLGEQRHVYQADRHNGILTFAPSLRLPDASGGLQSEPGLLAEVPAPGRQIRVWYRHGGGPAGNVRAGLLTVLVNPIEGLSVTNEQAATGGRAPESLDNAIARGPMSLHSLERAVTARDFELLAVRSSGGVNRAWACADATLWAHGAPGTVSVTLIPQIDDAGYPVTASVLEAASPNTTLRQVQAGLDARRPLGTACVVRWARYKPVKVKADVIVYPGEDAGAVRGRILDGLNRLIDPLAREPGRPGWPFGKAIGTWDVMRSIGAQAGIASVHNLRLAIDEAPERSIASLCRDGFQSETWYTASGSVAYRSGNNGESWEVLRRFEGEEVVLVDAYRRESGDEPSRAGLVCLVTRSANGSKLYLSRDCGDSFLPVNQFQFAILGVAWIFRDRSPGLFLATPSGLYEVPLAPDSAPVQLLFNETQPALGANSVAVSTSSQGQTLVAVAGSGTTGVFISASAGQPGTFVPAGLRGELVRILILQHTPSQRYLWAGVSAAGRAAGNGCFRIRLTHEGADMDGWQHYGANWSAGTCRSLAHDGRSLFAGSLRLGVLHLDPDEREPAWRTPDVSCGLPLRDVSRLQPVNALAATHGIVIAGGPNGLYRSKDTGVSYSCCSETEFENEVPLPDNWVFCSGDHAIKVTSRHESSVD